MISERAKKSKLSTWRDEDGAASFLGSKDFPPALVEMCRKYDPKCMLFDIPRVPEPSSAPLPGSAGEAVRQKIEKSLAGKRLLLCSGGDDKLVPYQCSVPFVSWLKEVVGSWLKHCDISIEDKVYPGIGHTFSLGMIEDSVRFILENVEADSRGGPSPKI